MMVVPDYTYVQGIYSHYQWKKPQGFSLVTAWEGCDMLMLGWFVHTQSKGVDQWLSHLLIFLHALSAMVCCFWSSESALFPSWWWRGVEGSIYTPARADTPRRTPGALQQSLLFQNPLQSPSHKKILWHSQDPQGFRGLDGRGRWMYIRWEGHGDARLCLCLPMPALKERCSGVGQNNLSPQQLVAKRRHCVLKGKIYLASQTTEYPTASK